MTTVTFHYVALVSIVLRAYRIRRFYDVYNEYFQKQEEFDLINSQIRSSSHVLSSEAMKGEDDSLKLISEISKLRERELIFKKLLKIIAGSAVIGALSMLVPFFYSIVPVYETKQCCEYFGLSMFHWAGDLENVLKVNIWSYLILNWLELLILVALSYLIRNIRD